MACVLGDEVSKITTAIDCRNFVLSTLAWAGSFILFLMSITTPATPDLPSHQESVPAHENIHNLLRTVVNSQDFSVYFELLLTGGPNISFILQIICSKSFKSNIILFFYHIVTFTPFFIEILSITTIYVLSQHLKATAH